MSVGRISGPLLFANLERNGIDLAFRNTLDETQLLYLDVNNGYIGVNTGTPTKELDVNGTIRSTLAEAASSIIANFIIEDNNINVLTGNINLNAADSIKLSNFETDNIHISDNTISSFRSNANIELSANGTGTVEILSNLNVTGDLNATGNITLDGNLIFGDAADDSTSLTDTVTFNSDVNSDINPDQTNTYNLGSSSKRWAEIATILVNGGSVLSTEINLSEIRPFSLRQGNIIYVSENGDDTNVGDHPNGPFKTIKHALDFADASTSGPVLIYVYAGGYEEELPLVVPTNVSIIGEDMRNTIIRPTSADQSKDIFHLNGETTVQNLTIKDFYYDSLNDTGYAFRFAPNTTVTTRSPYVQNVTVITQGTTTSADDPRGFASGDAGKGALVDGADVTSASQEASMLFHSSTFITPGVDAITMTNGVRVEWLNSFTYFANRGLYAVDGVTGHLSTDGSTVKYGAELRSIGSASVYGNYGAVADGADCLMYLIQHNFAYIGVGKYVDNDPSRVIQSQEVSELNSGKIYYQSIDHYGNFRVGNEFFVDQELGETTLELTEGDIDSITGLRITTNGSTTVIDGENIDVGNFILEGNTIQTITGPLNVASAGTIIFSDDTYFEKNMSMTGDLSIGGSLVTIGNQPTDTVNFNTPFSQDLEPDISGAYNLGSLSKKWSKAWLSQAQIGDIKFQDNFITTTESNADLELRASGTGKVYLPTSFNVTNNLTINGSSTIKNFSISGSLTSSSDISQTGNYDLFGFINIGQDLTIGTTAQFEEILVDDNFVTTTTTNSNLELRANGTGKIFIPLNNVEINNNFETRIINSTDVDSANNAVSLKSITSGQVNIFENVITTTLSNSDLDLRANGTGSVFLEQLQFNNGTILTGNVDSTDVDINLDADNINITSTKSIQIPKGTTAERSLWKGHIRFNTTDNVFEAYGNSGIVSFNGVYSSNRLTSVLADKTNNTIQLAVNGTSIGSVDVAGLEIHGLQVDDINVNSSTITTNVTNSNLELRRDGTGRIIIDEIEVVDRYFYNESTTDLTIAHTPNGYAKVSGTFGVRIPTGDSASRTGTPQIGETRYNTDISLMETWDGTDWIASAGGGSVVTSDYMEDLSNEWTLILG